jgi:hypothetical protein
VVTPIEAVNADEALAILESRSDIELRRAQGIQVGSSPFRPCYPAVCTENLI